MLAQHLTRMSMDIVMTTEIIILMSMEVQTSTDTHLTKNRSPLDIGQRISIWTKLGQL